MSIKLNVLSNDANDNGGYTSTISSVTQPSHGVATVVVINGEQFIDYDPVDGYTGPDSFTYTVTYEEVGDTTATVNLNVVAEANTPPVITIIGDSSLTVTEAAVGDWVDPGATASDVQDGSNLIVSKSVTGPTGVVSKVDLSSPGVYSVVYSAVDSGGLTAEATRTVTVETPAVVGPSVNSFILAWEAADDGVVISGTFSPSAVLSSAGELVIDTNTTDDHDLGGILIVGSTYQIRPLVFTEPPPTGEFVVTEGGDYYYNPADYGGVQ